MALLEHFFNEEAVEVTSFLSASKVGRFNVVVIAKWEWHVMKRTI